MTKHRRQDASDPAARARREAAVSVSPPDPVMMTMFTISGLKVLFALVALVGFGFWMRYGGKE